MLILSTKGRYGTRLMIYLATRKTDDLVLLKDIAESESISKGYLEQLVPRLKAAGLIQSVRGASGGYKLAKKSKDITLKDILESLEGPLTPTECVIDNASCNRAEHCVPRCIWVDIKDKIDNVFDGVTLKDMAEKVNNDDFVPNYQI